MSTRDKAVSIAVGDEVRFLWPSQASPALTHIDAHYDVMDIRDGEIGVQRTIHRGRPQPVRPWHYAPLSAVQRCTDGHRCPTAPRPEDGAR